MGKLIAVEGLDRCGKTTQISKLIDHFTKHGISFQHFKFPDRSTAIGQLINSYLANPHFHLDDHVIHLLFSANRWEQRERLLQALQENEVVLLDRYWYSGVAYSAAKGLDFEWCKWPDCGLPVPDLVLFFDLSPELSQTRPEYGDERYERTEFQQKVRSVFMQLYNPANWTMIDASQSIEQVFASLLDAVTKALNKQPVD